MRYVLPLIGMVFSFVLIKEREMIGDMIGEPSWVKRIGGPYTAVVIVAIFIFFWSVAEITGTTHVLFQPLLFLMPGMQRGMGPSDF